jgi:hypothetical protein
MGGVGILSLESISGTRSVRTHGKTIRGLVSCPGTELVASYSDDGKSILWDLETGQIQHELTGHGDMVTFAEYDAGAGQLATASHDETLRLWNVETGRCVRTFRVSSRIGLGSLALSPDGSTVAACGNVFVWVWHRDSGELMHTLQPRPGWNLGMRDQVESVHHVRYSPDGRFLFAFHSGHVLEAWNVQQGLPPDEMEGGEQLVRELLGRYPPEVRRNQIPNKLWDHFRAQSSPAVVAVGQTTRSEPWFLARREGEMELVSLPEGTPGAWLPMELRPCLALRSSGGLRWVGAVGNHLCLLTLEGAVGRPAPQDIPEQD